jgi:hypothetical protein
LSTLSSPSWSCEPANIYTRPERGSAAQVRNGWRHNNYLTKDELIKLYKKSKAFMHSSILYSRVLERCQPEHFGTPLLHGSSWVGDEVVSKLFANWGGFQLEGKGSVGAASTRTPVAAAVNESGGYNVVSEDITPSIKFFRLNKH